MPLAHMLPLSIFTAPPLHRHARQSSLNSSLARRAPVDLRTIDEGFGLPSAADPDPFGVLALQQAGLAIKEAGSQQRASSDAFEYRPSPTSPAFRLSLQSGSDGPSRRASRRDSKRSMVSVDHGTQTADLPAGPDDGAASGDLRDVNVPVAHPRSPVARAFGPVAQPASPTLDARPASTAPEPTAPAPAYRSPIHDPWADDDPRVAAALSAAAELVHSPEREAASDEAIPAPASLPFEEASDEAIPTSAPPQLDAAPPPLDPAASAPAPVLAEAVQSPIATRVTRARLVTIRGRPAPALPSRNPLRAVRPAAVHVTSEELLQQEDDGSSAYSASPARSGFDGEGDEDGAPAPWSAQTSIGDGESVRAKGEASRQGSVDEVEGRKGSGDAGSPLRREVGAARAESDAEMRHSSEGLEAEGPREEDEFHSVPPSPAAAPAAEAVPLPEAVSSLDVVPMPTPGSFDRP